MWQRVGFCALAAVLLSSGVARAEHYKIWIKAFIPNTGLDIVQQVPGTSDQWMIPGPQMGGVTIGGACFNTNNRGFDSSPDADAKVTASIEFDFLSPGLSGVQTPDPVIGETLKYDCSNGAVLARKTADAHGVSVGAPALTATEVAIQFDGQATNPLAPGPDLFAPAIKFHGKLTIDTVARKVRFDGSIRQFPCYEAYVQVDGKTTTVFQIAPAADASAWSLYLTQSISRSASY